MRTARGHADLLRESVDGQTGEDPPGDQRITPAQFSSARGSRTGGDTPVRATGARFVPHWFVRDGLALVEAIGRLADAADHHPDVDLRYRARDGALTTHAAASADATSSWPARSRRLAAELGVTAEPSRVQGVESRIDALDIDAVRPFWEAVLGYRGRPDDDLVDPRGAGPACGSSRWTRPAPQRNRIHVDVACRTTRPSSGSPRRSPPVAGCVSDEHAPACWVLADPEGNEACVCTWQGRD